ncbi:type IV secretory system conjugative DNA transfer family protein [Pseudomonas aeruginosa]
MLKPLVLAIGLLSISSIAFAAKTPGVQDNGLPLKELQSMHYYEGMSLLGDDDIKNKRKKSMRDAALAVGAQHGYVAAMNELRKQIAAESDTWDELYSFKNLMRIATPGQKSLFYLPPVIVKLEGVTASSPDHMVIKVSDVYYEKYKEERLVQAAPDWKEYLLIDMPVDVSKPVGALLPKTPEEQQLWSDSVAEGWQAGVSQANAVMSSRVQNLKTDYNGMLLYLQLVEGNSGQIRPTYVATETMNRVKGRNSMHLGQKTFAITALSDFNDNVNKWVPLDLDPREGYRTQAELNAQIRGE